MAKEKKNPVDFSMSETSLGGGWMYVRYMYGICTVYVRYMYGICTVIKLYSILP